MTRSSVTIQITPESKPTQTLTPPCVRTRLVVSSRKGESRVDDVCATKTVKIKKKYIYAHINNR